MEIQDRPAGPGPAQAIADPAPVGECQDVIDDVSGLLHRWIMAEEPRQPCPGVVDQSR